MGVTKHKEDGTRKVSCGVITVSDTRTTETDRSGKFNDGFINYQKVIVCMIIELLLIKEHKFLEAVENMARIII